MLYSLYVALVSMAHISDMQIATIQLHLSVLRFYSSHNEDY